MEYIDHDLDDLDIDTGLPEPATTALPTTTAQWQYPDPSATLGNPEDAWWFQQSADGLCVPASCAMIVSELTGSRHSEAEVVKIAQDAGLITPNGDGTWSGMSAEQGTQLLQLMGIPAQTASGGTIDDLERWVEAEDRSVILAVDSDEVWHGADDDGQIGDRADHALRLAEIDRERGVAILEDPGSPNGRGYEISLATLEDAWADSGNECVVTSSGDSTPAAAAPTPADPSTVPTATGVPPELPTFVPTAGDLDLPELRPALAGPLVAAAGLGAVILIPLVVRGARQALAARSASS